MIIKNIELEIRPQTAQEEFDYLLRVVEQLPFLKEIIIQLNYQIILFF